MSGRVEVRMYQGGPFAHRSPLVEVADRYMTTSLERLAMRSRRHLSPRTVNVYKSRRGQLWARTLFVAVGKNRLLVRWTNEAKS